jgi:hypothetical protein
VQRQLQRPGTICGNRINELAVLIVIIDFVRMSIGTQDERLLREKRDKGDPEDVQHRGGSRTVREKHQTSLTEQMEKNELATLPKRLKFSV